MSYEDMPEATDFDVELESEVFTRRWLERR